MLGKTFIDHFSALEDPRQAWKVVYPLPEILHLVLCATLAGSLDFVEVARWGRRKLEFLRRLLPYARGTASHDTLNDVMNALPAALFAECFTALGGEPRETAPDIVAIDGKTSRPSRKMLLCRYQFGPSGNSQEPALTGRLLRSAANANISRTRSASAAFSTSSIIAILSVIVVSGSGSRGKPGALHS